LLIAPDGVQRVSNTWDSGSPSVEVRWGALTASEGATEVRVPIRRLGPADTETQVTYEVSSGTAVAGIDFVPTNGMVTMASGTREGVIVVPLSAQNSAPNDDRTIQVRLLSAQPLDLAQGRSQCTVTLQDDDTGLTSEVFSSNPSAWQTLSPHEIYSDKPFFAKPQAKQLDSEVYYEWDYTGPTSSTNDYFAMIWTGWVVPEVTGTYQIATESDDGSRLWLDDRLVINNWALQSVTKVSVDVALEAGKPYRLALQYFEGAYTALCRLEWKPPGATNFAAIPRRVLRPGSSRMIPPVLSTFTSKKGTYILQYGVDCERPIQLQISTNGRDWKALGEGVVRTNNTTEWFYSLLKPPFGFGTGFRAVTVDGLFADYAPPLTFSSSGNLQLAWASDETLTFTVTGGQPGSSVRWLRDGIPLSTGPILTLTATNSNSDGIFTAVVQLPSGVETIDDFPVDLRSVPLLSASFIDQNTDLLPFSPNAFQLSSNALYILDQGFWVYKFDPRDPTFPKSSSETTVYASQDGSILGMKIMDQLAMVLIMAGTESRVEFADLNRPWASAVVGRYVLPHPPGLSIDAVGTVGYASDSAGDLHILDFSDPTSPRLLSVYHSAQPAAHLKVDRGVAFLVGVDGGLETVDVSIPEKPVQLGMLPTDALLDVQVIGDYLIGISVSQGLEVFNVKDARNPRMAGGHQTPYPAKSLSVQMPYIAVGVATPFVYAGVELYDASSPDAPVLVGRFRSLAPDAIQLDGTNIYIAPNQVGLSKYGLSTKSVQRLSFPPPGSSSIGDSPIALHATSDSSLPILYTVVSGPGSIDGNLLTVTGTGLVVVSASQAGDDSHVPAIPVQQTLQVLSATSIPIVSVGFTDQSHLRFTFPTIRNGRYEVQSSDDLVHWTGFGVRTATDSTTTFVDGRGSDAKRFYRVVWN
jgi:PA14 domain/Calx-beta domain